MANRWAYCFDGDNFFPATSRDDAIAQATARLNLDNQPGSTLIYRIAEQVPPLDLLTAWMTQFPNFKVMFGTRILDGINKAIQDINSRPHTALSMTPVQLAALHDAVFSVLTAQSTNNDFTLINVEVFSHTTPV